MAPKIVTQYDPKPIPIRMCDWSATYENYEPFDPMGFGATKEEAIQDLRDQTEDDGDVAE